MMGSSHYSDGSLVGSICPSESGSGLPWLEPDIKRHICCFWMNPVLLLTRTPLCDVGEIAHRLELLEDDLGRDT